ncbi:pyrroline-5-carboxylate reductase [Chengkuizengella axinellae]|uniref:Pyrroline-5-carboxylate reductase n=1 Tax=Chengkuizengella axinellae TaxID=3064388 RepID=A0ABT9IWY3_9BACL|nr:pyrroline-5-carboxylate reductase [Chengkuizengella sp. 2205SS18-9]MDP5273881.1 pyrroline-5-carboxylate reductase [Chengkuizengella sp. 2205SS18-9]
MNISTKKICFIGAGSMAEAIFKGLVEKEILPVQHISVTNQQDQNRLNELNMLYDIQTSNNAVIKKDLIKQADILVLAMKPKDAESAFQELNPLLNETQIIVSVIAGLTIETIQDLLKTNNPIVRTMPNTSSSIGLGVTGISFSSNVNEKQQQLSLEMFDAIGTTCVVPENKLEILTGVSGSGPAYFYYMMEAMVQAGVSGGLSEEQAMDLTKQTILGAAHMVQETGEHPAELRSKVTSPGGATAKAIEALDSHHIHEAVQKAVYASAEKSKEMGEMIKVSLVK